MSKLIDKLILFIICIAVLAQHRSDIFIVVPVISAIAGSALHTYSENKTGMVMMVIWGGLCIPYPDFIFFLPLICYDLFSSRWRWALLAAIPALATGYANLPLDKFLFTVMFLGLSYLLKRRTNELERQKTEYLSLRDTAKEFSIRLESKNKELLEKQDYEIHLATLNERNRIARDIHDNIGHILSNTILQTGALLATCQDEALKERLKTLKDTLSQGMDSIRSSIHDLHEESVDLHAEVKALADSFTFCPLSLDYDVDSVPPKAVKYTLLAVVKEALSNVIRHSDASRVSLTLREHPAFYQLVVRDNGSKKTHDDDGIGLKNITQRVTALNGRVNITADDGFTVFVSIPKEINA